MTQLSDIEIYAIRDLVERETNFNVIDIYWNVKRLKNYIQIEEKTTEEEYTLLVFSICDGQGGICPKKLAQVKQRSQILHECQHENIMKYCGEFQLKTYYFIQLEKYGIPLDRWKIQYQDFPYYKIIITKIALQISNLLDYLHQKNLYVMILSLNNINIDDFQQIKIWNIQVRSDTINTVFSEQIQDEKEIQNEQDNIKATARNDIVAFGKLMQSLLEKYKLEEKFICSKHKIQFQSSQHLKMIRAMTEKNNKKYSSSKELVIDYSIIFQQQLINLEEKLLFESGKAEIKKTSSEKDENFCFIKDYFLLCHNKHPKNSKYMFYAAIAFKYNFQLYEAQKCLQMWKGSFPIFPQQLQTYYNQLSDILQKNIIKRNKEIQLLKQTLSQDPQNKNAIDKLITHYYLSNKHDQALSLFHGYQNQHPNELDSHCTIGDIYKQRGYLPLAIDICQEKLQADPYHFNTLQTLAVFWQYAGQLEESIKCSKILISLIPNNVFFYLRVSYLYQSSGNINKSISYMKKAIGMQPYNTTLLEQLGQILYDNKQYFSSIKCLELCEQIKIKQKMTVTYLGDRYFQVGLYEKAKQRFMRQLENQNDDDESYVKLGLVYRELGNELKAQISFQRALIYNSNNAKAHLYLSLIYYRNKHYYHAIQHLLKYSQKQYGNKSRNIIKMNQVIMCRKLKERYAISNSELKTFKSQCEITNNVYIYLYPNYNLIEENQQNIYNEEYLNSTSSDESSSQDDDDSDYETSEIEEEIPVDQPQNLTNNNQQLNENYLGTQKDTDQTDNHLQILNEQNQTILNEEKLIIQEEAYGTNQLIQSSSFLKIESNKESLSNQIIDQVNIEINQTLQENRQKESQNDQKVLQMSLSINPQNETTNQISLKNEDHNNQLDNQQQYQQINQQSQQLEILFVNQESDLIKNELLNQQDNNQQIKEIQYDERMSNESIAVVKPLLDGIEGGNLPENLNVIPNTLFQNSQSITNHVHDIHTEDHIQQNQITELRSEQGESIQLLSPISIYSIEENSSQIQFFQNQQQPTMTLNNPQQEVPLLQLNIAQIINNQDQLQESDDESYEGNDISSIYLDSEDDNIADDEFDVDDINDSFNLNFHLEQTLHSNFETLESNIQEIESIDAQLISSQTPQIYENESEQNETTVTLDESDMSLEINEDSRSLDDDTDDDAKLHIKVFDMIF